MRKLALSCSLGAGDIVVLTALVRELNKQHPNRFDLLPIIPISYNGLFRYNPYIRQDIKHETRLEYPDVINCNPMAAGFYSYYNHKQHFIHYVLDWFSKKLNLPLETSDLKGDIYLAEQELVRPIKEKYCVVIAGAKIDSTVKFYPHWQEVVDGLDLTVLQCGSPKDYYPKLKNAKTISTQSIREFVRAIYHSEFVIAPVTAAIHIAGCFDKKAVVLAGGYEPAGWIQYKNQIVLNNFTCCDGNACFKKWAFKTGHGQPHQECLKKFDRGDMVFSQCMVEISPERVLDAVKSLSKM